jgi:hypothetical protein
VKRVKRILHVVYCFVVLTLVAACGGRAPGPITVRLVESPSVGGQAVRVEGLSSAELRSLVTGVKDTAAWQSIVSVTVSSTEATPIAGTYSIVDGAVQFAPQFGFDAGREYVVRVDLSKLPEPRQEPVVVTSVRTAARPISNAPLAEVSGISPGSGVWPENLLRFYIHFSAPMSRAPALEYVRLLDADGLEVRDAFLPLEVDLWNVERTRYTMFFDPGRVKTGIRPNVELGRAMYAGRHYAIVIADAWPDAHGRKLAAPFRYDFVAGPGEERAIDPKAWTIKAPSAGTRDPLVVSFPWALDRGLLGRAVGVAPPGRQSLPGEATITDGDREWRFVPSGPWRTGNHDLVVLTILEDPAGNRVGRPFEIDMFRAPAAETREQVTVPFTVR